MKAAAAEALQSLVGEHEATGLREIFGERVAFNAPLAPFTSWKIGGPADALADVQTTDELAAMLQLAHKRHLPWFVLGSGSNLLVGDGGIRGIVVRLGGAFSTISVTDEAAHVRVEAGASASMALVTAQAASQGAVGIGSLAGIPGSLGGALRMNAGTDREIGEFVRGVWVQTPTKPQPHEVTPQYFYRHTTLAKDAVVARVTLRFERGDPQAVRAEMQERLVRRKRTQPLQFPNAGSCFRNPPGDKAGRLIEAAGAKGWREGGAEVSELHANFIVNRDTASASDVATLLARIRRVVAERFGVELDLEVHFVGVFV
ncbi:MAG TPA: UDP-N-acetylmuramate dehydrogenase [Candidatus Baltobacteraceae bacterium]